MKKLQSLLALLTLSLVAVFAVGCGDSENFVFTGNTNTVNPGNTGALSFRFDRALAQTEGEVPAGTTQLLFSLHSGNPPSQANLVDVRLLPFSDSVILEDVDPSVTVVVVTALSSDGFPLAALQGNANVIVGTTQPVDLGTAQPITFDAITVSPDPVNVQKDVNSVQLQLTLAFGNGSVITLPSFDAPEVSFEQDTVVANITSTGLVSTGVGGQNTTATATFNLFGTERSDDFSIQTFCFDILGYGSDSLQPGTSAGWGFAARFIGPNGVELILEEDFDDDSPEFSYAIEPTNVGVSLSANNEIVVASTATNGTPFNLIVTYTDPVTGFAVTAPLEFEVGFED